MGGTALSGATDDRRSEGPVAHRLHGFDDGGHLAVDVPENIRQVNRHIRIAVVAFDEIADRIKAYKAALAQLERVRKASTSKQRDQAARRNGGVGSHASSRPST